MKVCDHDTGQNCQLARVTLHYSTMYGKHATSNEDYFIVIKCATE